MSITYERLAKLMDRVRGEKQVRGKHMALGRLAVLLIQEAGVTTDELLTIIAKEGG